VIAEDEALIRLDLREMLEEEGYVVVGEAGDGETALQLAEQLKPDLVIMDVKMPGLDGISAAEQITASQLAPVIILTAFSQRDLVQRASEAGAMAYLIKPFTKADLVPAIEVAASRFAEIAAGGPQAAGPGEGAAPGQQGHDRGAGIPVDPEDLHGPAPDHARGGRGSHGRGRAGKERLGRPRPDRPRPDPASGSCAGREPGQAAVGRLAAPPARRLSLTPGVSGGRQASSHSRGGHKALITAATGHRASVQIRASVVSRRVIRTGRCLGTQRAGPDCQPPLSPCPPLPPPDAGSGRRS
jgi:CheY-like chemotaxis protein